MHIQELVRLALLEDVGGADVTTESCVPEDARATARIIAKQPLVVSGHREAAEVFRQLGPTYTPIIPDGAAAEPGAVVARVGGAARALLTGERTALNFLMRLCGIATHTRRAVGGVTTLRVVDTRKTTPLHRASERRAVRHGGGSNHRFALYDGILIKDNHIVAAGGVTAAIQAARGRAHHLLRVEIEVETLDQAREAADAGADALLLDNMSNAEIQAVTSALAGRVIFEASGNMTAERLPTLEGLGVDIVSMGGLIHQARWADLSMRFDPQPPAQANNVPSQ